MLVRHLSSKVPRWRRECAPWAAPSEPAARPLWWVCVVPLSPGPPWGDHPRRCGQLSCGEWEAHSFTSVFHTQTGPGPGTQKTAHLPSYRAGVESRPHACLLGDPLRWQVYIYQTFWDEEQKRLSQSWNLYGLLGSSRVGSHTGGHSSGPSGAVHLSLWASLGDSPGLSCFCVDSSHTATAELCMGTNWSTYRPLLWRKSRVEPRKETWRDKLALPFTQHWRQQCVVFTRDSGQAPPGAGFYSAASVLLWPRTNHLVPLFEGSLFGKVGTFSTGYFEDETCISATPVL